MDGFAGGQNFIMRYCTIDIGTNTILFLVVDVRSDRALNVITDQQAIARLGRGVDRSRLLSDNSMDGAIKFINGFLLKAKHLDVDSIAAIGTSALRDASNSADFCTRVKNELGLEIEILSGQDEAVWTYRGAMVGLDIHHDRVCVLDIGGGSTEISFGDGHNLASTDSIDIGCVRITERYLHHSPPAAYELERATNEIRFHLKKLKLGSPDGAIGVAGTVTTLAAYEQQLPEYDPQRIHGYRLKRSQIDRAFEMLSSLNLASIKEFPQISEGRADILLAGILILREFLALMKLDEIVVSDRGLRYGIVLREMEKRFSNPPPSQQ
jgi:exopolyphosphatase/guanosine-5'-triphosphate,3'-diphosphate pyrophosphatase